MKKPVTQYGPHPVETNKVEAYEYWGILFKTEEEVEKYKEKYVYDLELGDYVTIRDDSTHEHYARNRNIKNGIWGWVCGFKDDEVYFFRPTSQMFYPKEAIDHGSLTEVGPINWGRFFKGHVSKERRSSLMKLDLLSDELAKMNTLKEKKKWFDDVAYQKLKELQDTDMKAYQDELFKLQINIGGFYD